MGILDFDALSAEELEALKEMVQRHPDAPRMNAELEASAEMMREWVEALENEPLLDPRGGAWENLAQVRASDGPDACPCMWAMTCPLHACGCKQYRMPWECNCDR